MRNRGHILDGGNADAEGIQSADAAFTSRAGPENLNVNVLKTIFKSRTASLFASNLSSERRGLTGALETLSAGGGRRNDVALAISDRDDSVIEGRVDVSDAFRHNLANLLTTASRSRGIFISVASHANPLNYFLSVTPTLRGPLRVRALVLVLWPRTGRPRR